jgi:hypothetical protein
LLFASRPSAHLRVWPSGRQLVRQVASEYVCGQVPTLFSAQGMVGAHSNAELVRYAVKSHLVSA